MSVQSISHTTATPPAQPTQHVTPHTAPPPKAETHTAPATATRGQKVDKVA